MAEQGFSLRTASGARRLTVHCRYCGATMSCPPEEADFWKWLAQDDVKEFYRFHKEHAGDFAYLVGAEIEFDDGLTTKKKDDLPPLINLLTPEGMQAIAALKQQ